jgi:molybdopterin-containing oxidoreductase family membrane subunit
MSEKKGLYGTWLVVLGIAILLGIYTAIRLFAQGHYLFNTNDVIIWSLPLGVYIFLALTSSGLTLLAGIPLVLKIKKYEPFAKRLVFLAIATLLGGFVAIGFPHALHHAVPEFFITHMVDGVYLQRGTGGVDRQILENAYR